MTPEAEQMRADRLLRIGIPIALQAARQMAPDAYEAIERQRAAIFLFGDDDLPLIENHMETQAQRSHPLLFHTMAMSSEVGLFVIAIFAVPEGESVADAQRFVREEIAAMEAERDKAYHDDTFEERPCDYCGKPYRGPAAYCSHRCARKDA